MSDIDSSPGKPGDDITIAVADLPPPGFASLCWKVFFESRNRGLSLRAHLPWLDLPRHGFFVTLGSGPDTVAGCAVKFIRAKTDGRTGGAVGLVCVDERHRGKGHSSRIIECAIAHAVSLGLADLVLWTGKPGVYRQHGFTSADDSVFGQVSRTHRRGPRPPDATCDSWPNAGETRGLPAFASGGHRWRAEGASAIVVRDALGPILAEWTGSEDAVANLLEQILPATWRINALSNDGLLGTLADRGWAIDLKPSNLQMIRPLSAGEPSPSIYGLRVLDRI